MVSIQFLGAAGTVTGSKHLLKTPDKNILVDCGLFQGIKSLRLKNWEPLAVDTGDIDLIILTHAHLDHCGYLPLLVKNGYKGKILMTSPTLDLTKIILRDSAKIQEEDAERANRKGFSKHNPAMALYTLPDTEKTISQFDSIEVDTWEKVSENIRFRFIKNGHILGSAYIEFDCYGKKIIFSGDLGRSNSDLMYPPQTADGCDYLVMESTYGDRLHPAVSAKIELADVINECIRSKGNLLIPSFAVGRAQELMMLINQLKKEIKIPDVPVIMDSPMGAVATTAYLTHRDWHKLTAAQCEDMFKQIKIITDFDETRGTIADPHIKIVIAASGMLTGGRVLEYLTHYVSDPRNTILLVGYQAEGTRGRALRSHVHEVKVFGKYYPVRATIKEISGLSAHADQGEMLSWLKAMTEKPQKIYLVHGEQPVREAFSLKISDEIGVKPYLPVQNEEMILF
jgi:metallo-beta-lactamase family protein